jgi:hypothetical protein
MTKKLIDFISHLIDQLSHPHIPNTLIYPIWNRVGEREGLGEDWGCCVAEAVGFQLTT